MGLVVALQIDARGGCAGGLTLKVERVKGTAL